MKRLALTLFAVAAFSGSALAADMAPRYSKAPPPAPVAIATWTGCYLGGGGGYGMWNQENTTYADDGVTTRALLKDMTTSGGRGYFGTVQGGCDYQFNNFVVGAFGDYDFGSIKGRLDDGLLVGGAGDEKLSSQWAVGGRVGYLVLPNLLTYFSAGYTEARFDGVGFNCTNSICLAGIGSPTGLALNNRTYKGWFIGAGDEYALSFLPGLFWKTEYRVSELDGRNDRFVDITCSSCFVPLTVDSKKWVQTVRSELVYRFNWGGSVVAKY
jgi:outer membrane immunogenic protein